MDASSKILFLNRSQSCPRLNDGSQTLADESANRYRQLTVNESPFPRLAYPILSRLAHLNLVTNEKPYPWEKQLVTSGYNDLFSRNSTHQSNEISVLRSPGSTSMLSLRKALSRCGDEDKVGVSVGGCFFLNRSSDPICLDLKRYVFCQNMTLQKLPLSQINYFEQIVARNCSIVIEPGLSHPFHLENEGAALQLEKGLLTLKAKDPLFMGLQVICNEYEYVTSSEVQVFKSLLITEELMNQKPQAALQALLFSFSQLFSQSNVAVFASDQSLAAEAFIYSCMLLSQADLDLSSPKLDRWNSNLFESFLDENALSVPADERGQKIGNEDSSTQANSQANLSETRCLALEDADYSSVKDRIQRDLFWALPLAHLLGTWGRLSRCAASVVKGCFLLQ